jgi:plastocyanin
MRALHVIIRGRLSGLLFLGTLFALVVTAAPAAAAPSQAGARTWRVGVGVASADQAIQGMAFLPRQIWVDVGDTITWTVQSGEFHTVTFLATGQSQPPFDLTDPKQTTRQGGSRYDGRSYYNSGLLMTGSPNTTYRLTFDVAGDYTYVCLVHSMMKAVVHVRSAGTAYPYTQSQYDRQSQRETGEYLRHGRALEREGAALAGSGRVTSGIGDGAVAVMRFQPETTTIHVGQTVTWVNLDTETPHTVTFGKEPPGAPLSLFQPYGNPNAFDGTRPLNSGFIGMDPHWFGTTYRVRFTNAGTYRYICGLHDELGMVGTVVVKP